VLFDSGTLTFDDDPDNDADGAEWLFAAVDNPGSGMAPLRLLASNGRVSTVVNDRSEPASLRVFHAAADTPAVDVVLGDDFAAPLATGLAYEGRSPVLPLSAGTANLNFPATGTTSDLVLEEQIEVRAAQRYDLVMVDADSGTDALVAEPDPRSVATQARIRLVNAAPRSELFSGYLATGATGSQDPEDRVFLNVAFRTITPYVAVAAGNYQLVLTERPVAATDVEETVTIGPVAFELTAGDVVTLLILPPDDGTDVEILQTWDDTAP
jgi:hypothetical protein